MDAVRHFLRTRTKSDLLELGLKETVTLAPVNSLDDLARFQQLEERSYWLTAPLPNGTTAAVPGLPALLTETPMNVRLWPPTLGQHNQEILGGMLGLSETEIAAAAGKPK